MTRTSVLKTYKLYINGQFPRSESGHVFAVTNPKTKKPVANAARGSRKDMRDAVQAARKAFKGWSGKTAYNRGQILYRMAEVLEQRKNEFIDEIQLQNGVAKKRATDEVLKGIDRLVWYAGWSDKYQQILGSVNPVAAPYFNFTLPEPMGVLGVLLPDDLPLLPLISKMAPAIVAGNTIVMLASEKHPLSAVTFGEVLATSDLPGGVVNILTGFRSEIASHMAKHMDINALHYYGADDALIKMLQTEGATNVKRVHPHATPKGKEWFVDAKSQSPYWIEKGVEMKTTWHPVGV